MLDIKWIRENPEALDAALAKRGAEVLGVDIARNLVPAAGLGMTTVWVTGSPDWAKAGSEDGHIHHVTDDLAGWLETRTAKAPDTPGSS